MRDGQQMLLDVLAWIETSCVEELQVKRPGSTQRCCTSTSYTLSSVAGDYVAVLYNLIPFDKKVAATAAPSWSRSTATATHRSAHTVATFPFFSTSCRCFRFIQPFSDPTHAHLAPWDGTASWGASRASTPLARCVPVSETIFTHPHSD